MSRTEIEQFYNIQTDKVKQNATIVSADELGQDYMLHISKKNMSKTPYTPIIGNRQAPSEDRSIPRVTVAPTLLGCIYGFASTIEYIANYNPKNNTDYKQGFYIHTIPFEYCLKPNNKLVYDASLTSEHWLVRYSEQTNTYNAKLIGKLFCNKLTFLPVSGKTTKIIVEFYVSIDKAEGIKFNDKAYLNKGFYAIEFEYEKLMLRNKIDPKPITSEEFFNTKKLRADMLSHKEPLYYQWS
jgi:hypothetical protein